MGTVLNLVEECEKRGKKAHIEPDPLAEPATSLDKFNDSSWRFVVYGIVGLCIVSFVLSFVWFAVIGFVALYSRFGWLVWLPFALCAMVLVLWRKKEPPTPVVDTAAPKQITYIRGARLYLAYDETKLPGFDGPNSAA